MSFWGYKKGYDITNSYIFMEIKFSLSFFRKYFRIPSGVKLCWCILVEKSEKGEEKRLGVMLCGTNKVIDVAARQFVQTELPTPVSYVAYVSHRSNSGDEIIFKYEDGRLVLPVTYVADIYFRCVYSEEMMNLPLI